MLSLNTSALVTLILSQNTTIPPDLYYAQGKLKTEVRVMNQEALCVATLRSMQLCSERAWLYIYCSTHNYRP